MCILLSVSEAAVVCLQDMFIDPLPLCKAFAGLLEPPMNVPYSTRWAHVLGLSCEARDVKLAKPATRCCLDLVSSSWPSWYGSWEALVRVNR